MRAMEKFSAFVSIISLVVMALLLTGYVATFVRWKVSPVVCSRLDSWFGRLPTTLFVAGAVLLILGALLSRTLGISAAPPSKPLSTLLGWAALLIGLLAGITAFTHKPASLRIEETEARIREHTSVVWKAVTPAEFEAKARYNLRRHVSLSMIGLLLCTGAILAQPKKASESVNQSPPVEPRH